MLAPLPDRGLQGLLQTAKEVVLGEVWVMERAQAFQSGICFTSWVALSVPGALGPAACPPQAIKVEWLCKVPHVVPDTW